MWDDVGNIVQVYAGELADASYGLLHGGNGKLEDLLPVHADDTVRWRRRLVGGPRISKGIPSMQRTLPRVPSDPVK